MHKRFAN
jgi:hypothetical protein